MIGRILKPVVIALLLLSLFTGCKVNPVTGKKEFSLVSETSELQMGHGYHPDIIFMYDGEYQDPELKQYLGTIVTRLHKVSHRSAMPVDFTVLNTSMINAFATPGHVYATRGFLTELKNEAQFAAVMGHELAHVAAGHSASRMSTQILTAVGLGVMSSGLGESDSGGMMQLGAQLGVTLLGLSYSRKQEHQADRVGTYYMALAGWDPNQSIAMQELLGSFHKNKPSFLDKYLSTHPPMDERIADIRSVISEKDLPNAGLVQGDGVFADRWQRRLNGLRQKKQAFEHYDRAMGLFNEKKYEEAIRAAVEAAKLAPEQAPFYRLQGDALHRIEKLDLAKRVYGEALKRDPRYVPANIGLGWMALEQGNHEEAEKQFAVADHGYPGSADAKYGLGVTLLKEKKYEQAVRPLLKLSQAYSSEPSVHFFLGTAYYGAREWEPAYESYRAALDAGLENEQEAAAKRRVEELAAKLAPEEGDESETK